MGEISPKNLSQEKTIKLRDFILNPAILRPRTKFRSLPEHFSSILCSASGPKRGQYFAPHPIA